jgi:cell division protein FtsL
MNTRTGNIGSFPFPQTRSSNLRLVLISGFVVLVLMLYVGGKVQIMRLGYQIEELEKQKRDLERMNRSLQIEASSLSAPGRIEDIAVKRLGMVRPLKENVVVVKRKKADAAGSELQPPAK